MRNWRARLAEIPAERDLAAAELAGMRLVCPGDSEWPTQLDVLGDARPYALWLRGRADLRNSCLRAVSVVGARAATAYGAYVAAELSAGLANRGWVVVSGGAYGVDGAAHRGALAADGLTVVVLACGVDDPYPPGHRSLFDAAAAQGTLMSEWPPGRNPKKYRFLVRNRVIAALSRGTVVVEARRRSGALSTARYARDLCRPLMAVPGPITSEASAGCHWIMREWGAVCVTGVNEVLEQVALVGEHLESHGPVVEAAELDPLTARVRQPSRRPRAWTLTPSSAASDNSPLADSWSGHHADGDWPARTMLDSAAARAQRGACEPWASGYRAGRQFRYGSDRSAPGVLPTVPGRIRAVPSGRTRPFCPYRPGVPGRCYVPAGVRGRRGRREPARHRCRPHPGLAGPPVRT